MTYYSGISNVKYLHFPLSLPDHFVPLLTYYSGVGDDISG